jgi:hypothetical protein
MAADDKPGRPYVVGHGKPPKKTQFKKGQSGNPKGRPKGSRNLKTEIERELKRKVTITEDGRRKRITKREAVAKQLVNKAVSGDPKAIPVLLKEVPPGESDAAGVGAGVGSFPMTPEDDLVLENMIKRIQASGPTRPDSSEMAAVPNPPLLEAAHKGGDEPVSLKTENDDADE